MRCPSHMRCTGALPEVKYVIYSTPDQNLSEGGDQFFSSHISRELWSHWSWNATDVACRDIAIRCFHAWLPQHQGGGACVAQRTEVQVARVTRAES